MTNLAPTGCEIGRMGEPTNLVFPSCFKFFAREKQMQIKVHSDGKGEHVVEADDIWEAAATVAIDEGVDGQQDDPCWDGFSFLVEDIEFAAQLQSITEDGGSIEVTRNDTGESHTYEL